MNSAKALFLGGKWRELLDLFENKSWSVDVLDDPELLFYLAKAYDGLGFPEFATPAFAKALQFDPLSPGLRLAALKPLFALKEWALVLDLLTDQNAQNLLHQANGQLAWWRAQAALADPHLAEQHLIALQRESDLDLFGLGVALTELNIKVGDFDRATSCIEKLREIDSESEASYLLELELICARWHSSDDHLSRINDIYRAFPRSRLVAWQVVFSLCRFQLNAEALEISSHSVVQYGLKGILVEQYLQLLADTQSLELLRSALAGKPQIVPPDDLSHFEAECLINLGRHQEAAEILRVIPDDPCKWHLEGIIAARLGHSQEHLGLMRKIFDAFPESADHQFFYADALLAHHQWVQGWQLYESRFDRDRFNTTTPAGIEPRHSNITPDGKHVLVFGEQGVGDTVMMASIIPDLLNSCASLTLFVQPRLQPLMSQAFPDVEVLTAIDAARFNSFDACYGIGSIGQFFRLKSTDFPGTPYLKITDTALLSHWEEQLNALGPGLKVGLGWRGGRGVAAARRSLDLVAMAPLLETPNVSFVNLQYQAEAAELAAVEQLLGVSVHSFEHIPFDLLQTTALIQSLDLVVTVQQTNVHLAGSVGTPALVLVPIAPEWRYGVEAASMPWYGSVELFRQASFGSWDAPLMAVQQRLLQASHLHERQNGSSGTA